MHQTGNTQLQKYIVDRIRNAVMHGNLNISIDHWNKIIIIFSDIYNNRKEEIQVSLENLRIFLSQKCLYDGVPYEAPILMAKSIDT